MRKIVLLLMVGLMVFSCKKKEVKNKIFLKTSEKQVEVQNIDTTSINKGDTEIVVKLPNNSYAVVALEPYSNGETIFYKPKKVNIFDSKTKKEIPEIWLEGIFYDNDPINDDHKILYGDFNFDGKMDIACVNGFTNYAGYYTYNFYLATVNGYQLNKSFSEMTETPVDIKLDAKYKKIIIERTRLFESTELHSIKNDILVKEDSIQGPFMYNLGDDETESVINGFVTYKKSSKVKEILTFNTQNRKGSIMLLVYKDKKAKNNLYYAEMRNDTLVDYYYDGKFSYNQKKGTLQFGDESKKYKVYENENDFGIEIAKKGETTKLTGNPTSKKGSLSRITEPEIDVCKNVVIQ